MSRSTILTARWLLAAGIACAFPAIRPVAAAAPAGGPDASGWLQVDTENFTLLSSAPEKLSLELGRRLEVLRFVLSKVYPNLQLRSSVPTWVLVFRDKDQFQKHLPRGQGSSQIAGYFTAGVASNYAAVMAGSSDDAMRNVYHEYVHFIIRNNLPDVPLWFEEGLAECFEGFRFDGKRAEFARLEEDHLRFMRSRSFMPLGEFLAVTTDSKSYRSGESGLLFHVQAWTLVHYLLWDRPDRRPQLIQFLEALRAGHDIDEAFASGFQTTYGKLEGDLRSHVEQRRFMIGSVSIDGAQVQDRGLVRSLKRAELLVHLGDLLVRVAPHRDDEAEKNYQEALRLDAASARAQAGLGEIYERRGRADEADQRFASALAMAPEDPWVNFTFARSLLRRRELEGPRGIAASAEIPVDLVRARALFQKTIEARPDFGEAYLGFAKTFLYGGGPWGAAIPPLEAARGLLPNRADVLACLVVAQARKGSPGPARESLAKLASMSSPAAVGFVDAALARPDPVPEDVAAGEPSGRAAPTLDQLAAAIEDPKARQRLAELLRRAREGDGAAPSR